MAIPVKIPTRKYLRDFLAFYYENQTLVFEQGSEDYKFMRSLVSRLPLDPEPRDPFFDSRVTLQVGDRNYKEKTLYVSNSCAWKFYLRYHRVFTEYFLQYVNSHRDQPGFKIESTIRKFAAEFDWTEDDIKHETLLKIYQRKGEGKPSKKSIKIPWTPPTVPLAVLF